MGPTPPEDFHVFPPYQFCTCQRDHEANVYRKTAAPNGPPFDAPRPGSLVWAEKTTRDPWYERYPVPTFA